MLPTVVCDGQQWKQDSWQHHFIVSTTIPDGSSCVM